MKTKVCNKCLEEKSVDSFYLRDKKNPSKGLKFSCKVCENVEAKERYHKKYRLNPDTKKRNYINRLLREYGLTEDSYKELWEANKGKCTICSTDLINVLYENSVGVRAVVDHCHSSGKVRGLLCHKCNGGLGQFNDDLELIEKALYYLKNNS